MKDLASRGRIRAPRTVGQIHPAEYNPRKISDERLALLGKSMAEFGDISGLVVNLETGNLVGGHQRLKHLDPAWTIKKKAVKDNTGTVALGTIQTPNGAWSYREVRWPAEKERVANLAANQHRGEWDTAALEAMLKDMPEVDRLLAGFTVGDMPSSPQGQGSDAAPHMDKAKELNKQWQVQPGQIWACGSHRIACGRCEDGEIARRLMGDQRATLVFTDPPYGVSIGKKNEMLNTFHPSGRCLTSLDSDDDSPVELGKMLLAAFTLWRTFLADNCSVFVCSPQGGGLGMMMMMMMKDAGLEIRHVLNWVKNSPAFSMHHLDYDYAHEPILFTWVKTHKRNREGAFQTSLWAVDKPRASEMHPTIKPVELPTNAILNHTDVGDIVVDMFLGSGTTMIAAQNTGRTCYAVEKSPDFVAVCLQRFQDACGVVPTVM